MGECLHSTHAYVIKFQLHSLIKLSRQISLILLSSKYEAKLWKQLAKAFSKKGREKCT